MKGLIKYFWLGFGVAVVSAAAWMVMANQPTSQVVNPSSAVTYPLTPPPAGGPSPTPTPTPYVPSSPKPSLSPQATPTTPSSGNTYELTNRFAGQYGIDANVLRHVAQCESGFNPGARNGPYLGLFQFSAPTWKKNRVMMGEDPDPALRLNAQEAIQTAAYMISMGKAYSWPNCFPK